MHGTCVTQIESSAVLFIIRIALFGIVKTCCAEIIFCWWFKGKRKNINVSFMIFHFYDKDNCVGIVKIEVVLKYDYIFL